MHANIVLEHVKPYFQPIVCVDTGDVFAYELLGRLNTPQGITSLGPFFHNPRLAPEDKVVVDRLIRSQALELFKREQRKEVMFINIQPRWLLPFSDSEYFPTLEMLNRIQMEGAQVVIEICEEEFAEDDEVLAGLVKRYRQAGCKIAIDDFGRGFSSMDRILLLRPDYLKIGAKMMSNGPRPEVSQFMMESVGMLCEKTGTSLILEEVETMEHFLMGLEAGVRFFQGYFFAEPGPGFLDPQFGAGLIESGLQSYLQRKTGEQLNIMEASRQMDYLIREELAAYTYVTTGATR